MRSKIEDILNDIILTSDENNLDVNLIYSKLEEIKKLPKIDPSEEIMGDPNLTKLIVGYVDGDNTAKLKLADYIISNIKAQEVGTYSEVESSDYKIEAQELGRSLAEGEVISKIRLTFGDAIWDRISQFANFDIKYIIGYLDNVQNPLNAIWIFSQRDQGVWIFAKLSGSTTLTINLWNQYDNVSSIWKMLTEMMINCGKDVTNLDLEEALNAYGLSYKIESKSQENLPPPKFMKSIDELALDLFNIKLDHPIVTVMKSDLIAVEDRPVSSDSGNILFFGSKYCLLVKIFRNYDHYKYTFMDEFNSTDEGNFPDERSSEDYMIVKGNYEVPPFEMTGYSQEVPNFCKKVSFESEGGIKVVVSSCDGKETTIGLFDLNNNTHRELKYESELLSDEDVYNICKLIVAHGKASDTLDEIAMECMNELSAHGKFN